MTKDQKIKIFIKYFFNKKVDFIADFYQSMKSKTANPDYLSKFDSMTRKVKSYQENLENSQKLIQLYDRILNAEQKTQEKKMTEKKKFITNLQKKNEDCDADKYLTEQLIQI